MIPKCCLNLGKGARGRMKATPLTIKGKVEAYTGTRSSKVGKCQLAYKNMKVVYQSESLRPVLASLSRTAELATRLKLTGEKMASENWQVGDPPWVNCKKFCR